MTMYIFLQCGLSNRIRTLFGYAYVAEKLSIPIEFHWNLSDPECNGKWSDLFEPIQSIAVIDTNKRPVNYSFVGQDTIPSIIKRHLGIEYIWDSEEIREIENKYYSKLVPRKHILNEVSKIFTNYDAVNMAAIHIRRTDHVDLAKNAGVYTTYEEFDKFIEENKSMCIYLATDSSEVQKKYKNCLVWRPIDESKKLRQTSLEHALIDILVASKCAKFKGSGYSSYSGFIQILRRLNSQL